MGDLRRRDFLYRIAAVTNIGAFSTLAYSTSRALGRPDSSGQNAAVAGQYGEVIDWPIIAIHAVLLPSGAVMRKT